MLAIVSSLCQALIPSNCTFPEVILQLSERAHVPSSLHNDFLKQYTDNRQRQLYFIEVPMYLSDLFLPG